MSTVFGPTARCRGPALPIAATSARTGLLHNAARRPKQPCHCKLRQFCDAQYKLPLRRSTEGLARKAMWARFAAGTRFSAQFGLLRRKSCACFPHVFKRFPTCFQAIWRATLRGGRVPGAIGRDGARPSKTHCRPRAEPGGPRSVVAVSSAWRAMLRRGRVLHVEGHALSWPCPPPGGPCSVVAVFPVLADATAARPSIRLEPLPIAILKTYKGHARSWPCPPRGGPRSVVAVFSVLAAATAARPSNLVAAAGRFRL